jgi:stage V sporulation protein B
MNSAMILVASTVIVKIIGILYKIPITEIIGLEGYGYFESAYNVYIPIYSIALAGLPVAVSRMVAHYSALGRFRDVRRVQKIAFRLFLITGFLGTALLLAIAYPYAYFLVDTPEILPLLLVIAPAVLICALMSAYRGYYNGLRNMYPSAISEVIEAFIKAGAGIWLAKLVVDRALAEFHANGVVFGQIFTSEKDVIVAAAPKSAMAAIAGVTISTVFSLLFLVLRHRFVGDRISQEELRASVRPEKAEHVAKRMLEIATPIVLSSLIFNLTSFIDSTTVLNRLGTVAANNPDIMRSMYAEAYEVYDIQDIKAFLLGAYGIALNFKNLLPTLTMTLGVSAIPVLTEAWTLKQKGTIKRSIESVLRVTMLLALPAGIGMAALAEPIIRLLYNSQEVLAGLSVSAPTMVAFGLSAFLIASSQPTTSMLQGIGRSDIPLYSTTIGAVLKIAINFVLIAIPEINIFGAVIGSIVCYSVIVLINYVSLIAITKVKVNLLQIFFKPLFCALLCGGAAWASYGLLSRVIHPKLSTLIAVAVAMIVYVVALLYTRAITKHEVHMMPMGKKISPLLEKYKLIG